MRLGQLIETGDYSGYEFRPAVFENWYDTLSGIIYPDSCGIAYDHFKEVENSDRVKMIAIREWLCTDTHVGFYLYFLDDKPICTMYQSARKNYPEWSFFSKEAFFELKNFFDEMRPDPEEHDIPLIASTTMRLECDPELQRDSIGNVDFGLSCACSDMSHSINAVNRDNLSSQQVTYLVNYFKDVIQDHIDFVNNVLDDEDDIRIAEDAAKDNIKAMKEFLEKYDEN